jgi:hypothetical protein
MYCKWSTLGAPQGHNVHISETRIRSFCENLEPRGVSMCVRELV